MGFLAGYALLLWKPSFRIWAAFGLVMAVLMLIAPGDEIIAPEEQLAHKARLWAVGVSIGAAIVAFRLMLRGLWKDMGPKIHRLRNYTGAADE